MKGNFNRMAKITTALLCGSFSLSNSASARAVCISNTILYLHAQYIQQTGSITDRVIDCKGMPVANVHIKLQGVKSTKSNKYGSFKFIDIQYGTYHLTLSSIGFETIAQDVQIDEQQHQLESITLTEQQYNLGEVVVTASRLAEHVDEVPSSITYIGGKELDQQRQINDNLPSILMQKVPSISTSVESQNNFIAKIRGRNFLVLIDGIP